MGCSFMQLLILFLIILLLSTLQPFFSPEQHPSVYLYNLKMINMNELYLEVKGKWNSLYPIYFDANKTIAEGRKLPKALCVKEPTLEQLTRAVCLCKLRNIIEPHKAYPRDYFQMGRLKVQVFDEKDNPVNAGISSKKKLLQSVARCMTEMRSK